MDGSLSRAGALCRLLALMGEQGCSHEQRRTVADTLSANPITPKWLIPHERKVIAEDDNGHRWEIHYPPASVPNWR